eukprot:Nk52_evm99s914 gene=Nk52_evmTU99s914
MGVPGLFRFITQRYPDVVRDCDDVPNPEFDNLYLDFNGVVHLCTHEIHKVQGTCLDETTLATIYGYLEALFDIAQPKKLLYLAIDGVAPAAKLSQQRQRRFISHKAFLDFYQDKKEMEGWTGEIVLRPEEAFDLNVITPGTQFLEDVTAAMVYYVIKKMNEDSKWKKIKVIISGHRVPGEGEHKIVDFIRRKKSSPNYDSNTRHCFYGLDADLILLALSTHEPHFCLLREKITYSGRAMLNEADLKKNVSYKDARGFEYFHVGLLRQYLELEFSFKEGSTTELNEPMVPIPTKHDVYFNLERTIDDIIFLTFFSGNDFLPCLPGTNIHDGGLEELFVCYNEAREHILSENSKVLSYAGDEKYNSDKNFLVNATNCEINWVFFKRVLSLISTKEASSLKRIREGLNKRRQEQAEDEGSLEEEVLDEVMPLLTLQPTATGRVRHDSTASNLSVPVPPTPRTSAASSYVNEESAITVDVADMLSKAVNAVEAEGHGRKQSTASALSIPATKAPRNSSASEYKDPGAEVVDVTSMLSNALKTYENKSKSTGKAWGGNQQGGQEVDKNASAHLAALLGVNNAKREESGTNEKASAHLASLLGIGEGTSQSKREEEVSEEEYSALKDEYYSENLASAIAESNGMVSITTNYIEGLKWILHYYFQGLVSWNWYYKYHFTPLASTMLSQDLIKIDKSIHFEPSEPLKPFQQLLSCLPSGSGGCMPKCLADLMTNSLKEFYPKEYSMILDPFSRFKDRCDIPFIDKKKLVEEHDKAIACSSLSPSEKLRNCSDTAYIMQFNKDACNNFPPPLGFFPELRNMKISKKSFVFPPFQDKFRPVVCKDALIGHLQPPSGFPSLQSLPYTAYLKVRKPKGSKFSNNSPSVIVRLSDGEEEADMAALAAAEGNVAELGSYKDLITKAKSAQIARMFVGNVGLCGYPFLIEGIVESLYDSEGKWSLSKKGQVQKGASDVDWDTLREDTISQWFDGKGIDCGKIHLIADIRPLVGMRRLLNGALVREYNDVPVRTPVQAIPNLSLVQDERYFEKEAVSPDKILTPKTETVYLGSDHYGCVAIVNDYDASSGLFSIEIKKKHGIDEMGQLSSKYSHTKEEYIPANSVASGLGIQPLTLARLSSRINISLPNGSFVGIGMQLKSGREELCVAGYTRKAEARNRSGRFIWEYSRKAYDILAEFKEFAPDFFEGVDKDPSRDSFSLKDLNLGVCPTRELPEEDGEDGTEEKRKLTKDPLLRCREILDWIRKQENFGLPLMPCSSNSVSQNVAHKIEEEARLIAKQEHKIIKLERIRSNELIIPGSKPLFRTTTVFFPPFTRVINICSSGSVPFGLQGTVISCCEDLVEVLFDEPFISGKKLYGKCEDFRGFTVPIAHLLNLTIKEFEVKKRKDSYTNDPSSSQKKKQKKKGKDKKGNTAMNMFELLGDS